MAKVYTSGVFRAGQLVFLTIVSGHRGIGVFLDGALAPQASVYEFPPSPLVCSGSFVVGDSTRESNSWDGELHGLAIYQQAFTSEQAMKNYQSWARIGLPAKSVVGKPNALYLFNENGGKVVPNLGTAGVNLYIPEHYEIARQTLLEPPWSAFMPTWGYAKNFLINIGGFIPFGFTLVAFLSATGRVNRLTAIPVLAGFLVSLTIETLQAYLPTRNSGFTDVVTNTLGSWLGAMLYRSWLPEPLRIFSWMQPTR